jgi:hypothetical protein
MGKGYLTENELKTTEFQDLENWEETLSSRCYKKNLQYYNTELLKRPDWPSVIADIVVEFANDGFRIGQMIDARDKLGRWCIAEIKEFESDRALVHYIGWEGKWDRWVEIDETAAVFSHTTSNPVEASKDYDLADWAQKRLVQHIAGYGVSEAEVTEVVALFSHKNYQLAVNELMWRHHCKHMH